MVNISHKEFTSRVAEAVGGITLPPSILAWISNNSLSKKGEKGGDEANIEFSCPKGPVLATAVVAGTLAVKKTSDIIPFCHPLPIDQCDFRFKIWEERREIEIRCIVGARYATGVEMEALTGVTVAALTIYDTLKSIPKDCRGGLEGMMISDIRIVRKMGGKADYVVS